MNDIVDQTKLNPDTSLSLRDAITSNDADGLGLLLEPLPLAEALRELLRLSAADRALVLSLLPPNLAATLIEDAPNELGANLMEALDTSEAVKILDELDSDDKADLIGGMEPQEASYISACCVSHVECARCGPILGTV